MMQVLKVLGRAILISFGLVCIAAGGLCTVLGADMLWMALIGIMWLLGGVIIVWATLHNGPGKQPAADTSERESP